MMREKKKQLSTEELPVVEPEPLKQQAENFVNFYANHIELSFSAWDMRIFFSEVIGNKGGKPIIEDKARVVMSLHHAKAFVAMLVQNMATFEKNFGEIRLLNTPSSQTQPEQAPPPTSSLPKDQQPKRRIYLEEDKPKNSP